MNLNLFNAIRYFFYYKNRFSIASNIGPVSFDEYIRILGRENLLVTEDLVCKRIKWEDVCTLYVFRFSLNGEFQFVEREIWYEYKWLGLRKTIMMDLKY